MCVFKATHACNAVLMLLPNMVILSRLLVFQAIDFKTARDRFGILSKVGTRVNGVFDKALINDFYSVILVMIIII